MPVFTTQAETIELAVQKVRCHLHPDSLNYLYMKGEIKPVTQSHNQEQDDIWGTDAHYVVGTYDILEIKPNDLLVYKHL